MDFKLSEKYKDFLRYNDAEVEIMEGTTASGKTTTGIVKFFFKLANNPKKLSIIAGQNLGIVEKNIINCELGIIDIFGGLVSYYPKGKGKNGLPHLVYKPTEDEEKIIYVLGYDNVTRWKYLLGGQYAAIFVDECNTAQMSFINQAIMRCDYLMGTLNPDDPDKEIYEKVINRCRPIEKYKDDAPQKLLEMLDEPPVDKWVWWYFSFDHNAGLSEEKKEKIKRSHSEGTAEYLHYILGLRGKAEGVIFDNFDKKKHLMAEAEIKKLANQKNPEHFIKYTAGLDTAYSSKSPDTISMTFLGITNERRLIYIDEQVLNNRDTKEPFAPSDVVEKFAEFLDKNRESYGFARDVFIDSADQATITEAKKYRNRKGSIYNFIPAHKALRILDRINAQKGWIATGHYFVNENCKEHIKELQTYSWSDKGKETTPEDGNDHTINSQQYGWIPYKMMIGT